MEKELEKFELVELILEEVFEDCETFLSKNSETAKLRIQEKSREIGNKRKRTSDYLQSTEENLQIVNECTTPKASPPHTHPQNKRKLN